jgi:hypothetical protein
MTYIALNVGKNFSQAVSTEPSLSDMLSDPIFRLLMWSDRVSEVELLRVIDRIGIAGVKRLPIFRG